MTNPRWSPKFVDQAKETIEMRDREIERRELLKQGGKVLIEAFVDEVHDEGRRVIVEIPTYGSTVSFSVLFEDLKLSKEPD